ncbi:MAG: hypothetical protein L6V85_05865 [Clostridiales bacterium]|nr:MAG: hypothetical protein L6V85_05865 [Clostridiales bacterium]
MWAETSSKRNIFESGDEITGTKYFRNENDDYVFAFSDILQKKARAHDFKESLRPLYLRESQAEREARKKMPEIVKMNAAHVAEIAEIENVSFKTPWSAQMIADELKKTRLHTTLSSKKTRKYSHIWGIIEYLTRLISPISP